MGPLGSAGLNWLKAALQLGDCVKVAALDRLGRSLTEVLDLLGWLPLSPLLTPPCRPLMHLRMKCGNGLSLGVQSGRMSLNIDGL